MADKKISELDLALLINNDAVFPMSQDNAGEPTTFKVAITQLGTEIAEDMTFSNLQTTSKKLVGAINELLSLGNPIIIGTTAPTSSQGADGNIYIQYTEGTGGADDEVDGIFVKIDGAWCEISTGGGGAGGHTIVDDDGTALTQRTNLQFLGAYSEDNSTDDTTEVNVVREMTKAEFDLLSADEKTGLINITDITGGNDDRFQPVIYSEEERKIGVWLDGKPLYQKTLVIAGTSLTAGRSNTINHGISNVDYIQLVNGTYTFGDGGDKLPLPFADNYKPVTESAVVIEAINSSAIRIGVGSNYSGSVSPNTVWVTVQYTKTTDQAGSGQWTPQGVPAHHYSTDEQVIGTWVDGSTLYERSFLFEESSETQSKTYNIASYISNASMIVDEEIRLRLGVNANNLIVFGNFQAETYKCECHTSFRASTNTFQLDVNVPSVWKYDKVWYTIHYTKSA